MAHFTDHPSTPRGANLPRMNAKDFPDLPVAAPSTVAAVAKAILAVPSKSQAAKLRRIYAAWIRRAQHRRELDMLLEHSEAMFRDLDVTRDEVLRERNRPLRDFL